jgi:hypothetical protein
MRVYTAVVFGSPDKQETDITTRSLFVHSVSSQMVATNTRYTARTAAMLSTGVLINP